MSEAGVYYPPETRVLPLTMIRRERMLPVPGKVLVNPGDRVQPAQAGGTGGSQRRSQRGERGSFAAGPAGSRATNTSKSKKALT